jgi:ribonuclease HI
MSYEKVPCDRCRRLSDAYYTLSLKTKALYVQCKDCGNHAVQYKAGLNLVWRPSKTFIETVGKEEAFRLAKEAETNKGCTTIQQDLITPGVKQTSFLDFSQKISIELYCDAGTKNNGQYGKQETVIVIVDANSKVLREEAIGDKTNNEGELTAIIKAANIAPKNSIIHSDSDLAVKLINWQYNTKIDRLKILVYDAISAIKKKNLKLDWCPREKNLAGIYIEKKYSL